MKLKNLFLAALVLSLSACAFEKNKGLDDNGEVAIREKLRKSYKAIEGTYQGTLMVGTVAQKVELKLTVLEDAGNGNSSGATKMNPILIGNYKRLDPVSQSYSFTVRPYLDTNQLVLVNSKPETLTRDDVHTINATIYGTQIVGDAASTGGYLGKLDLKLTSRESGGGNGTTEENEYYDALRRKYQAIAGEWEGQFISNTEPKTVVNFVMTVQVLEKTQGDFAVPFLNARLHDKADTYNFSDWTMNATYNTDTTPYRLVWGGVPVYGNNPPPEKGGPGVTLNGTVENDTYTGSFLRSPVTMKGTFVLKRTKPLEAN